MNIAVMTDEVSSDLDTALELIHMWGVDAVDLRNVGGHRYPDVGPYWKARVPQLLDEYGLHVSAISPGLFKIPYPGPHRAMYHTRSGDARQYQLESDLEAVLDRHVNVLLPASIEAAQALGTRIIICFGFDRQDEAPTPEGAVQVLRHAAQKAHAAGLILTIESDDLSSRSADLVRRVNHPGLGINWDPGNAFAAGDDLPYPDGYQCVREFVRHVHFKDARPDPSGRPPILDGLLNSTGKRPWALKDGVIDWRGQMAALKQDGYDGYVVVEPHFRPQVGAALYTLERMRALLAEA